MGAGQQDRLSQESPTTCRGRARSRPPSFAGSKFAGVDRIEFVWISDPQTAMSALVNGEIDFWENPNIDFLPILEKAKGVKLDEDRRHGHQSGFIRLNHLHPPFNNMKARQAMYYLINKEDYLRTIIGNRSTTRSATVCSPAARRSPAMPAAPCSRSTIPRRRSS